MPVDESALVMIVRIDENVKAVIERNNAADKKLEAHLVHDEMISQNYIKPLWEDRQQQIGAEKARNFGGQLAGYAINACIACVAAWAAVKGLGH